MKHFVSLLILISISLATAVAQSVRGTVVDTSGEPVPGASVVVTGTTVGSITDIDGNFSITGVAPSGHLDVSFVGYVTNKVAYRAGQNLRIVLEEDNKMLEEVVAVGYGTQKKANLTQVYRLYKLRASLVPISVRSTSVVSALSTRAAHW